MSNLLEEYAILYEKAYGERETADDLIPFMLEAYINVILSLGRLERKMPCHSRSICRQQATSCNN
ncbi:MAG: DUF2274 domain-containing protein [Gammaproteobacteria bacterium]|nr:DUF2274 domain-containing protein [Gammaproteobacteria bacterium]